MKPPVPDPRYQAIAWAQVFRDDWEECRADPALAPEKARSLLAAWGAVCRVATASELPVELPGLSDLLERDADVLLAALRQGPEPAAWLEQARQCDAAWDWAVDTEALRELQIAAVDLFDRLDRDSLAVCMATRLPTKAGAASGWLADWQRQVADNEAFLTDHADAFFPAASLASATLEACREDLFEADLELWETTLKHRRLEEEREQSDADPALMPLSERDRNAVHAAVARLVEAKATPSNPPDAEIDQRLALTHQEGIDSPWQWLQEPALMAAAAGPAPRVERAAWCSPDGRYAARLDFDPYTGLSFVRVNFYRDQVSAIELAGPVSLGGVAGTIDAQGNADFPLAALCQARDQGNHDTLTVGPERIPWIGMSDRVKIKK